MNEWSEKRSSELELPDDMSFVKRQRMGSYVMKNIAGVSSAKVENWGARGNVLTVTPSIDPHQLETVAYAFDQDYSKGYI